VANEGWYYSRAFFRGEEVVCEEHVAGGEIERGYEERELMRCLCVFPDEAKGREGR
jgi:hypothetical protein